MKTSFKVWRIKLDFQGYDDHGGYYGVGEKLWGYTFDDFNTIHTLRAPTFKEAKEIAKTRKPS